MINLNVSTTNKAVSDFYRRIGFSQVEVITLSWNSTCNQKQIRLVSTAFWDTNLKNDSAARKWLDDGGFKQELGAIGHST